MIKLYKGDNIDVIPNLKEKYNIVYLDPPYNTKNGSLSYADKILDWSKYFEKRLKLIKNVLEKDAVIFTSIGHEEIAYAKIALENIFGKKSSIAIMPRLTNNVAKTTKTISRINDFLLINKVGSVDFNGIGIDTEPYKLKDKHFKKRGYYQLRRLDYKQFNYSNKMDFEIKINKNIYYPNSKRAYELRKKGEFNQKDWCWIWSLKKVKFALENDYIEFKCQKLYKKTYTKAEIKRVNNEYKMNYLEREKPFNTFELTNKKYANTHSKSNLEKLFTYPKSDALMDFIINLPKIKNKKLLDPFAGTGVVGISAHKYKVDATLIQISEATNRKSQIYKKGFKNIFDLTSKNLEFKGIKVKIYE